MYKITQTYGYDRFRMDRIGLECNGPNAGECDKCKRGTLVGMGRLGQRACFHAT